MISPPLTKVDSRWSVSDVVSSESDEDVGRVVDKLKDSELKPKEELVISSTVLDCHISIILVDIWIEELVSDSIVPDSVTMGEYALDVDVSCPTLSTLSRLDVGSSVSPSVSTEPVVRATVLDAMLLVVC